MLLLQDMGLGKTLTALALIAGSVTVHHDDNLNKTQMPARATTLIIAPLSSMYCSRIVLPVSRNTDKGWTALTGWQDQIER